MADPYTAPTISGYNSSPPADDGTETSANQIFWATIKEKLTDPLKTLIETDITRTDAAFATGSSLFASTTAKTASFSVATTDSGELFLVDDSGGDVTVTFPAAADAGDGFRVGIKKTTAGANKTILDGASAETIDGATTVDLTIQYDVVMCVCDGTEWHIGLDGRHAEHFLAYNSAQDANVTGAGTQATVDFDTELVDAGNNFASDTFTARVAGSYDFHAAVQVSGLGGSPQDFTLKIKTSNRTYHKVIKAVVNGQEPIQLSVLGADMDAADTVTVTVTVSNMAGDTADIDGGANPVITYFGGRRVI